MDAAMTGVNDVESMATPLDEARDAARFGRKAACLSALRALGHRVPDGFVIPVDAELSLNALQQALARLGAGPFAVRSSGVLEDLDDASFAGHYATVLGVRTLADVAAAVHDVRASAHARHPGGGREAEGAAPMAVLIQTLVPADVAGVAFSANPVTGDDEVVLEAVRGLGDKLVSGDAEGERWVERGGVATASAAAEVLDAARVHELAALVRRIARERGGPQDVEWALVGGTLHVLQARAITGLPVAPHIEIPDGRWQKDTGHFTGPLTPMGASIMLPAYERTLRDGVFVEFGLPLETVRQRSFGGEVYTQEVELGGGIDTGAPPPWWVLAIACRVVPSFRRRLADAERALPKLTEFPKLWDTRWRAECEQRVAQALAVDLGALDDASLLKEFERLVDEVLEPHLRMHFQLTLPHIVGVFELANVCEAQLGWNLAKTLDLLAGLSATSSAPTRAMFEIATESGADRVAAGLTAVREGPAGPRLERWLATWGLRTIDADPGTPCIGERDDLVLDLLRAARDDREALSTKRRTTLAEARGALPEAARAQFEAALALAEVVYPNREDNVPLTEGFPVGLVRRALLEFGRRLVHAGRLRRAEDVAFLERSELAAALTGPEEGESLARRVARRRAEMAWVLAHPGPMIHGPAPVPPPDVRGFPKGARRLMRAMLWALEHELAPPKETECADDELRGVACSPGTYTGRVRVVLTEADLARLQPGEVLVCRTTHSSWSVVFARAGALVADGGGILAHPAIIAREHRVPAVLGTLHATTRLRDGQVVTVDGLRGIVTMR